MSEVNDATKGGMSAAEARSQAARKLMRGDGCSDAVLACIDKLPCGDESDDGVPPFCRGFPPPGLWAVFNHDHPYTNHSARCYRCGDVGYPYYGERRRKYMGLVMLSTFLSMIVTCFGCFALSTNPSVVLDTHWSHARVTNVENGTVTDMYFGLRSVVLTDADGAYTSKDSYCFYCLDWASGETYEEEIPNPYIQRAMAKCRASAEANEVGSLVTCFTLIFAMIGVLNRMRFSSDAPVQKMLGTVTDTWGALSLAYTMYSFAGSCYSGIPDTEGPFAFEPSLGPGFWAYMFCALTAAHRAVMHWLTPVPGMGSGLCRVCSFADLPVHPAAIVHACRRAKLDEGGEAETPLEYPGSTLDARALLRWQDGIVNQGLAHLSATELRRQIISFQPIDEAVERQLSGRGMQEVV